MHLKTVYAINVTPTAPFDFDSTFHKPAHFPSGDNDWEPSVRWQTFRFLKNNIGVVFKNTGSVDKPRITADIY